MGLALVLVAAIWTTASADDRRVQILAPDPGWAGAAPVYTPTSGEPDVGGTPSPRSKTEAGSAPRRAVVVSPWIHLPPWVGPVVGTWSRWLPGLR